LRACRPDHPVPSGRWSIQSTISFRCRNTNGRPSSRTDPGTGSKLSSGFDRNPRPLRDAQGSTIRPLPFPLSTHISAIAGNTTLSRNGILAWIVAAILSFPVASLEARPQTLLTPDIVKLPAGINLGGSSFYDGFGGTDPGWVFLNYARWNDLISIRDNGGKNSPLFADPHIDAFSTIFHLVYISPIHVPNGALTSPRKPIGQVR
jgi:hypothetical protein